MKQWGEKAAGLRFMHAHSGGQWKGFADKLAITGIVVTGVASTMSLIATSVEDPSVKDGILFWSWWYWSCFNPCTIFQKILQCRRKSCRSWLSI